MLVQQAGKGKIYLNVMNGEIPEFRDILFMTLATHPDIIKEKPELLRKVAQVFTEAQHILKTDPKRGKELMGEGISEDDARRRIAKPTTPSVRSGPATAT